MNEMKSRPPRARGLKLDKFFFGQRKVYVAPPAGAWIETVPRACEPHGARVAPPAGAWIETQVVSCSA